MFKKVLLFFLIFGGLLLFNLFFLLITPARELIYPLEIIVPRSSLLNTELEVLSFSGEKLKIFPHRSENGMLVYLLDSIFVQKVILPEGVNLDLSFRSNSLIPKFGKMLNWAGDAILFRLAFFNALKTIIALVSFLLLVRYFKTKGITVPSSVFFGIVFSLLFLFCVLTAVNFNFSGDDGLYMSKPYNFLLERYFSWSGRLLVDFCLLVITKYSIWVWRILMALIFFIYYWSVTQLISGPKVRKDSWLIIIAPLLPFGMLSVGSFREVITWVTGSLNYFWTFSLTLLALVPYVRYLYGQNINNNFLKIICTLALFYACYMEQTGLLLFICSNVLLGYVFLERRKIDWYLVGNNFLIIMNLLVLFLSPGNLHRFSYELNRYPDFANLTFFERFRQGYAYMVDNFVKKVFFGSQELFVFPYESNLKNDLILILFFLFLIIAFYFIIRYIKQKEETILVFLFYILAFGLTAMIGFSPSIFISGSRVFFVGEMLLGLVLTILLKNIAEGYNDNKRRKRHP